MAQTIEYGNWIRKKKLFLLGLAALGAGLLAGLPLPGLVRAAAGLLCAVLLVSLSFPLYAYVMFSPWGGNLQERVYDLIITALPDGTHGKALDIGTGNGVLTIKLAGRFAGLEVTGMDYWGSDWEYAQAVCERNARIANVSARVCFVKGDAAALDFADGTFDAVVSNLTFHEVKSVPQKSDVLKEALRILRPGGSFAFVDYFYERGYYGTASELQNVLGEQGVAQVAIKPLHEVLNLPRLLRHPKILGKVGIVYGRK